jgi:hypothetical protein
MRVAIPLLPNTSSWHGTWLSAGTTLPYYETFVSLDMPTDMEKTVHCLFNKVG